MAPAGSVWSQAVMDGLIGDVLHAGAVLIGGDDQLRLGHICPHYAVCLLHDGSSLHTMDVLGWTCIRNCVNLHEDRWSCLYAGRTGAPLSSLSTLGAGWESSVCVDATGAREYCFVSPPQHLKHTSTPVRQAIATKPTRPYRHPKTKTTNTKAIANFVTAPKKQASKESRKQKSQSAS